MRAGETNRLAQIIQAGWAYRYERLDDGRRQILNFLIPGDIINIEALMFPDAPASFSVRALVAGDGAFDLPANQDHIADALGITPVHVNRTLRSFRASRLIEIERRRARILDRAALDRVAAG